VENLGRYLMLGGAVLVLVGGGMYLAARLGVPLGRMPGDVRIENQSGGFYFPVASCLILSLLLTALLNLIIRLLHK
jgi:hypothetical protein